MKALDKETAIARMNTFGRKDIPFLFIIDYTQECSYVEALDKIDASACLYQFRGTGNAPIADTRYAGPTDWEFTPPSPAAYRHSFDIVKQNLLAGNSYLTNLTCKVPLRTNLALKEIFLYSHALYKLWLKDSFVCFSPEIFVRMEEGKIKSFPMKGTIDATLPHAEAILLDDAKEAAEHATIVDLIRNDLSMVSEHVTVTSYRYIDRLQTNKGPILQTSSEICGNLPHDYTKRLGDILFKLLPAGSITGEAAAGSGATTAGGNDLGTVCFQTSNPSGSMGEAASTKRASCRISTLQPFSTFSAADTGKPNETTSCFTAITHLRVGL